MSPTKIRETLRGWRTLRLWCEPAANSGGLFTLQGRRPHLGPGSGTPWHTRTHDSTDARTHTTTEPRVTDTSDWTRWRAAALTPRRACAARPSRPADAYPTPHSSPTPAPLVHSDNWSLPRTFLVSPILLMWLANFCGKIAIFRLPSRMKLVPSTRFECLRKLYLFMYPRSSGHHFHRFSLNLLQTFLFAMAWPKNP